jgi:hypothetical protein
MKAFVLVEESGSYSDRSTNILAVFSSEEKALEAKKIFDKNISDIEEVSRQICNAIPKFNKTNPFGNYNNLDASEKAIFDSIISKHNDIVKKFIMNNTIFYSRNLESSVDIHSYELDEVDYTNHTFTY